MSLIVNLFAGPGAGKSTMMASIFAQLKAHNVNVEMATEFSKELTWAKRWGELSCQPYVFGEQLWRIESLEKARVDVIVTDSPLLLSVVYNQGRYEGLDNAVLGITRNKHRLNFSVYRVNPYDPRGRSQDEKRAKEIDSEIVEMLDDYGEEFHYVDGNDDGAVRAVSRVLEEIGGL